MSFADDFRAIALPRLLPIIQAQAFLMALGGDDPVKYSDAMATIHDATRKLGAGFLPDPIWHDLDDWICSTLLKEWTKAETRVAELTAQPVTDPVAHYRSLAANCRDPKSMQWVFASISPEYRAWLLASDRDARVDAG